MEFSQDKTGKVSDRCYKEMAQLLGIRETEARDDSLSGRLKIIAKLKAARRVEITRGRAGSWLYDVNRHLNLCAALRLEYDALAAFLAQNATEGSGPQSGGGADPDNLRTL
jgi:hypothetical protein